MINAEAQLWRWPHSHWVTIFEKGATDEYEFEDVDVGTIELVVVKMEQDLRLDFTSDPEYYLEKLKVSVCMILNNRQFEKKSLNFRMNFKNSTNDFVSQVNTQDVCFPFFQWITPNSEVSKLSLQTEITDRLNPCDSVKKKKTIRNKKIFFSPGTSHPFGKRDKTASKRIKGDQIFHT